MTRPVDVHEVQEYYARWELLKSEHADLRGPGDVSGLGQPELNAMIKSLAARRKNSMHNMLAATRLDWEESPPPFHDLLIPGLDPAVDPVIRQVGGRISEVARVWGEGTSPYEAALEREFRAFSGPIESCKVIAIRQLGGADMGHRRHSPGRWTRDWGGKW